MSTGVLKKRIDNFRRDLPSVFPVSYTHLDVYKRQFKYLPASFDGDMAAREQMHYAQCLAGMAFSNALLGIVHSMAPKTGAAFSTGHIPHGCANAIYLPYVIQFNAKNAEARYADIARYAVSYTHLDVYKRQGLNGLM